MSIFTPCTKCGHEREIGKKCSNCRKEYLKIHYQLNKEKYKEKAKNHRNSNPNKHKIYARKAYLKNSSSEIFKIKKLLWTQMWKKQNPEKVSQYNARYVKEHPDIITAIATNRRANQLNSIGTFTKEEWSLVISSQNYKCYDCHKDNVKLTVGHIVPLSIGGSNFISNIIAQCKSCNSKQATKIHPKYYEGK